MAYTIGITGGIGSGKSVVSRVLRCNGFKVYDCDCEAKHLMVRSEKVRSALEKEIGKNIYYSDGNLNRAALASIIFNVPKARKRVNQIVHTAVREDIKNRQDRTKGKFFIESAILASGGIAGMCNEIWIVDAAEEIRKHRVLKRDNLTEAEIEKRIATQRQETDLLTHRHCVLLDNGGRNPLLKEILKLTDKFQLQQTYLISC